MTVFNENDSDYAVQVENKYEMKPENNIPREVYGIPTPIKKELNEDKLKEKYNINVEDNVPQKVYGVMRPNNSNNIIDDDLMYNFISIEITINDYSLSLFKMGNLITMVYNGIVKDNSNKSIIISDNKFKLLYKKITDIVKDWKLEYKGNSNINWGLEIKTEEFTKKYYGIGEYPENWNVFVDLISEYELIYKKEILLQL